VKYRVLDDRLVVGTGLHFWNGLSRMSSFSFISTLAFDNPALNWPTLERTDQLGRMPGIFAHGQIHNLHYRVSINQPFRSVETLGNTVNQAMFQTEGISKVYAGYTEWNFLEKETHLLPFRIGTYLGKKKIFNIGAGFQYHKDVMASRQPNGFAADGVTPAFRIARHDQRSFAVDLFYDAPLSGDNGVLTVYAVGYYNDMGPNYIRNIGVMSLATNPATQVSGSLNGFGNGYPAIGTGTVLLAEAGWLIPKRLLPAKTMLQPYYRHTLLNYEALNSLAFVHDFGVNWYLNGQNAKITLQNRFRPLVDGQTKKQTGSLYEFILQTSFYF
jgi:hypothetical protein